MLDLRAIDVWEPGFTSGPCSLHQVCVFVIFCGQALDFRSPASRFRLCHGQRTCCTQWAQASGRLVRQSTSALHAEHGLRSHLLLLFLIKSVALGIPAPHRTGTGEKVRPHQKLLPFCPDVRGRLLACQLVSNAEGGEECTAETTASSS